MRSIHGILYCNDGDWVESRTAVVEHIDGRLELVHWPVPPQPGELTCLVSAARAIPLPRPGL